MVPTRPLFAAPTWKTLPRVGVLLLRLFASSLFAPAAVCCVSKGVFGCVRACVLFRTRRSARDLSPQERRGGGGSCCVPGSLEFWIRSAGKASAPRVARPPNTPQIEVSSQAFKSARMFMFSERKLARVLLLFGCCAVRIAHEALVVK